MSKSRWIRFNPQDPIGMLPAEQGSYALHLLLPEACCVTVGRLGRFSFPAGDYWYVGSAHGSGGLRARLNHHFRLAQRPHWHLDYLRPSMQWLGGWAAVYDPALHPALECKMAQKLMTLPGALIPVPGFGAADCRSGCDAHLILLPDMESGQIAVQFGEQFLGGCL